MRETAPRLVWTALVSFAQRRFAAPSGSANSDLPSSTVPASPAEPSVARESDENTK